MTEEHLAAVAAYKAHLRLMKRRVGWLAVSVLVTTVVVFAYWGVLALILRAGPLTDTVLFTGQFWVGVALISLSSSWLPRRGLTWRRK